MLLDHFTDPPILVAFVVCNRDTFRATANGKFPPVRGPTAAHGRALNAQNHKSRLPLIGLRRQRPDKRVTIVRARDDLVGGVRPIDVGDDKVVLKQTKKAG